LLLLAATPYLFVVVPCLCFLDWSFEVGLTSFFHNFIVDFRIEKVWYHGFFPISFYIKNLKIYFQKIEKLFDVYIFKKFDIPIFLLNFSFFGEQKIMIKQLIA
jgi:hypothetical protein